MLTAKAALMRTHRAWPKTHAMALGTHADQQKSAPFRALAQTFAAVEQARSTRDKSVGHMAACFQSLLHSRQDLTAALFLTAAQLAPAYDGVELRFGSKSFAPVIETLLTLQAGDDGDSVSTTSNEGFADFGLAVQRLLAEKRLTLKSEASDGLTIAFVHQELLRIATEAGTGSLARKQARAVELLQQCRCEEELVFLVRMLAHQSLRIGMGEKSILSALAIACIHPSDTSELQDPEEDSASKKKPPQQQLTKQWIDCVTKAYAQRPDFEALVGLLCDINQEHDPAKKIEWLTTRAAPTVGVPVLTMSAYPVSSVQDVLTRIRKNAQQSATCEFKYDGARVQIHAAVSDNSLRVGRIFSRNMEDNTERYSSLLELVRAQLANPSSSQPSVTDVILEGEVVAMDRATGSFLPFQVLQTKTTTEYCLFVFDLLAANGKSMLNKPLRDRKAMLQDLFVQKPGYLEYVESIDLKLNNDCCEDETAIENAASADEIKLTEYLQAAVNSGCEGLMIKTLDDDSEYKAGVRSFSWMKVKHDYLTDASSSTPTSGKSSTSNGVFLPDTLDLVPVGAFYGKGRRAGVLGSFLMATYDSESGCYETITKVGTGFSDVMLAELTERLLSQRIPDVDADAAVPPAYRSNHIRSLRPDVWLNPSEVWEIKATQLTLSPSYACAQTRATGIEESESSKGIAMRFPRFLRTRPDKTPHQATDSSQVADLFQQQQQNQQRDNQ